MWFFSDRRDHGKPQVMTTKSVTMLYIGLQSVYKLRSGGFGLWQQNTTLGIQTSTRHVGGSHSQHLTSIFFPSHFNKSKNIQVLLFKKIQLIDPDSKNLILLSTLSYLKRFGFYFQWVSCAHVPLAFRLGSIHGESKPRETLADTCCSLETWTVQAKKQRYQF